MPVEMAAEFDVLVVGAGVIGLAVGAELAEKSYSVGILEKNPKYGLETSSRNSEVIHSGIHYLPGSLKARCCVEGNNLLYDFCRHHNLISQRCGKITVATSPEEITVLEKLYRQGKENGVPETQLLDKNQLRRLEPEIQALSGLLTGSTGLVDAHGLMDVLAAKFRQAGGLLGLAEKVVNIEQSAGGYKVFVRKTGLENYTARIVINCAGLYSDEISRMLGVSYSLYWAKGDYFSLHQKLPVSHLVYPAPTVHGLGVHLTPKTGGGFRLGPDTEYVEKLPFPYPDEKGKADFRVAEEKKGTFYESAHKYLPGLRPEEMVPEMFGIRPKLQGPDDGFRDFIIREERDKGCAGFINLVGIESPGLTCCLSIARLVRRMVSGQL